MYSIDFQKIVGSIKENEAKRVMVQLPDGLKPRALEIYKHISQHTDAEVLFWAGSNFGACDTIVGLDKLGVDLLIHLGHTEWLY